MGPSSEGRAHQNDADVSEYSIPHLLFFFSICYCVFINDQIYIFHAIAMHTKVSQRCTDVVIWSYTSVAVAFRILFLCISTNMEVQERYLPIIAVPLRPKATTVYSSTFDNAWYSWLYGPWLGPPKIILKVTRHMKQAVFYFFYFFTHVLVFILLFLWFLCNCSKVMFCMYVCYMLFNKYSILKYSNYDTATHTQTGACSTGSRVWHLVLKIFAPPATTSSKL